jgi:hypothetical protein
LRFFVVTAESSWLELGPAVSPFTGTIAVPGEESASMKTPVLQAGRALPPKTKTLESNKRGYTGFRKGFSRKVQKGGKALIRGLGVETKQGTKRMERQPVLVSLLETRKVRIT